MKRRNLLIAALICFLIAAVCASLMGQETTAPKPKFDPIYRYLQTEYTAMGWADLTLSYIAINHIGGYKERYAPAQLMARHPELVIGAQILTDLAVHYFADLIYRDNKALAYGFVITMNLARAYVLYHNFKALGK